MPIQQVLQPHQPECPALLVQSRGILQAHQCFFLDQENSQQTLPQPKDHSQQKLHPRVTKTIQILLITIIFKEMHTTS